MRYLSSFFFPFILCLFGCDSEAPPNPPIDSVKWVEYTHPELGYSIQYPGDYSMHKSDGDIIFRLNKYPVLAINYVTEQEARERGLWIKHAPVETIVVDHIKWKKFIYTHYDGPFGMRTITYATEFKGKWLGIEFRTSGELDEVHRAILNSLQLKVIDVNR